MRFRTLGPVRVRDGGRWVPVSAEQQRLVLAVLLADAGRAVSTERLVDEVWGDQPPRRAVNTVQAYVMRLRRMLGDDALITRGHGYELVVADNDVDASVFEQLVTAGRRERDAGRPEPAAVRLADALALWRGPAFADVPHRPALVARVAHLERLRVAAEEDHAAVMLELDRCAEAVDELQRLVDEHPLREGRWALLMEALHRCGRRADALTVFHRACRVLRGELGLDPGPRLREVQRAVLATAPGEEPARSTPAPRPSTVPAAAPAQLPADVAGFTGRDSQLKQLDSALPPDDGPSATAVVISAIAGTAGVGKTALAVWWAHRVRDRFDDGQLYVNLRGFAPGTPVRPVEALARFLRALDVPAEQIPSDVDEASALYRTLLADRRVLVLLDNARDPDQVRPLLPGGPGCLALITSRHRLDGLVAYDGAVPLTLDVLGDAEAYALLARLLGSARVDAEPQAVAELTALCGNLPLALRIAAANLAARPHTTISGYNDRLRQDRLGSLQTGADEVRVAFDLSYHAQPEEARRLFRLLGLNPGHDTTAPAAAALAGTDRATAAALLDQLAAAHLVDEHAPGRYALHDLLREYAADRAVAEEPAADRDLALDRLYEHFQRHVDAAAELLYPEFLRLPAPPADPVRFAGQAEASAWVDTQRANLVAAVRYAAEHGPRPAAWRLADGLRGYFLSRLSIVDWQVAAEAGLAAAEADHDRRAIAAGQLSLALLSSVRGRYEDSIAAYERAVDHAQRAGWAHGEASGSSGIGGCYQMLGRLELAADHLSRSLELRRRLGWAAGEATALANLGLVSWGLGRLEQAADHHRQAAAAYREMGAAVAEARANASLGVDYHSLGRLDDAVAALTPALAAMHETGDRYYLCLIQFSLADVYRDLGELARARELAEAALVIAEEMSDRSQLSSSLAVLACIHERLGDQTRAIAGLRQALTYACETSDQLLEADELVRLAGAYHGAGRPDTAADLVGKALDLARRGGYRVIEGQARTVLAAVHLAQGEVDAAAAEADRALRAHRETGHRLGEARTCLVAGAAAEALGDCPAAEANRAAARELFAGMGVDRRWHAAALLGVPAGTAGRAGT